MARSSTRYFSDDDPEIGVTPSQLKRLAKARQVEYLTSWFHTYFEDPAEETPYNSREGGYLYVHGGPYDARDELEGEFGSSVSEEVLELAVEEVQSDGHYDWAPTSRHPSRADEGFEEDEASEPFAADLDETIRQIEGGAVPHYGDDYERRLRGQLIRDIEELEFELPRDEVQHGGIGHNHPPADMQMTPQDLAEARDALAAIKSELRKEEPDIRTVAKSAGVLNKIWAGVKHHTSLAGDEFSKNVGGAAGKVVGAALGGAVVAASIAAIALLGQLVSGMSTWLSWVTLPF